MNSLKDIWNNSKVFKRLRQIQPSQIEGVCNNCLAREVCRGGCRLAAYLTYENLLAPDPACQSWYHEGLIPDYALIDASKDCSYP